MLHTDLQDLFEGLSELFFSPHDDLSNWTEGDWKSFDCKCEVVKDKWQTMLVKWHQLKQFQWIEEEDQKPVVVENNKAPKKRRWTEHT